jgi:hypothetical protein
LERNEGSNGPSSTIRNTMSRMSCLILLADSMASSIFLRIDHASSSLPRIHGFNQ